MNFSAAKIFMLNELDRLSPALTYHGKHHTLDVMNVAKNLCVAEGISIDDTCLVLTAALFHDSGFLRHYSHHEFHGCQIAHEVLPQFGYTEGGIQQICTMIMATKIPQSPSDVLSEILCDADLDYLGRDDFYTIADTLFAEMKRMKLLSTETEWYDLQIRFLESHHYFTPTSQLTRSAPKRVHLDSLKNRFEKK